MKKLWIIFIAVALLIPLGVWWSSPKQVVMRRTKHLLDVASMAVGTGGPLRQAKVFSMNAMLAPEVTLTAPDIADANGTFDKAELESAFSWICQNAKSSEAIIVKFRNVDVTGDNAEVRFTAKGFLELSSGRPVDGTFDVTIRWIKGGDGWRFEDVVCKSL